VCADCAARSRSLAHDTALVTFEASDVSSAVIFPDSQFRCLVASCPVGAKLADIDQNLSILQSLPEMTEYYYYYYYKPQFI